MPIIKLLTMTFILFQSGILTAKELDIRYRDYNLNLSFADDSIKVTGYQFNMKMTSQDCNKSLFLSIEKELNALIERVDAKISQSKSSSENIIVSTDRTKKEAISPQSPFGARVLGLRSYMAKMQFQENEVCKKP
jgi:hypothetical protein